MAPKFSFDVDVSTDLLIITMAGFFGPADVEDFSFAREIAQRRLTSRPNQHCTLVDIRDMKIQSQEAVTGFQTIIAERKYQGRRIAIVVSSSLARSQIKRAANGRGAEYFTLINDAEAWLLTI